MPNPVAVLISDVHYSLPTLKLADAAMRTAIRLANDLEVPLVVAGDLHDTKANLRGECVNAMIETFDTLNSNLSCFILRGNHDSINEKSKENSIRFLEKPYIAGDDSYYDGQREHLIIANPAFTNEIAVKGMSLQFIPYQHDPNEFRKTLKYIDKGSTIICHQGIQGSQSGDYIQDKSAINPEDVAGFRVISGHYHTRQTIQLPDGGTWDYIGNPYTLNYAEANDPEKGFQILMSDGSLEFVATNLRKHVVVECHVDDLVACPYSHIPGDLLWFKCAGPREALLEINKKLIADNYGIREDFRLTLEPTDSTRQVSNPKNLTRGELLDSLIDATTNVSDEQKSRLRMTWKSLCE